MIIKHNLGKSTVPREFTIPSKGAFCVFGDNASGKSTVIHAIQLALAGSVQDIGMRSAAKSKPIINRMAEDGVTAQATATPEARYVLLDFEDIQSALSGGGTTLARILLAIAPHVVGVPLAVMEYAEGEAKALGDKLKAREVLGLESPPGEVRAHKELQAKLRDAKGNVLRAAIEAWNEDQYLRRMPLNLTPGGLEVRHPGTGEAGPLCGVEKILVGVFLAKRLLAGTPDKLLICIPDISLSWAAFNLLVATACEDSEALWILQKACTSVELQFALPMAPGHAMFLGGP